MTKTTFDTFDAAKPRFSNRGLKRRSVSTLSPSATLRALSLSKGIPRASDRGVEGLISQHSSFRMSYLPNQIVFYFEFCSLGFIWNLVLACLPVGRGFGASPHNLWIKPSKSRGFSHPSDAEHKGCCPHGNFL